MKEFITSPSFLFVMLAVTAFLAIFTVLWKNIHWPARDVTPDEQIKEQKERFGWLKALFPKSSVTWWLIGATILILFIVSVPMPIESPESRWSLEAPSPGVVWGWTKNHWLWILIASGALVIVSLIVGGKWATALQWGIGTVLALLFVVIPLVHVIWGEPSAERAVLGTVCPDASARETRSCVITPKWSNKIKIGDGPEASGMLLCALPGGAILGRTYERAEEYGTTFWRFRTEEGHVVKSYRLVPAGEACPATL